MTCDEDDQRKHFVKTASTTIETQKPLVKDEEVANVDVTPKTSHLQAVKRMFRYLKGQPKLGLWYPKVSSFDLEAYLDSDYVGANLDRKSTTGGCQFLGRRLISWQCKKQTIVATSTTEAEYVAAAHCFQKQMVFGKDFSNPLMANNLPKIIWFSTTMLHSKELASPKQTNLGKDESNPLIVASLLKTIWKLERKRRSQHFGLKRLRKIGTSQRVESSNDTVVDDQEDESKQGEITELDADEDVTLVDVDTTIEMDVDTQGRMEEDVTVVKEINAAESEPTVYDDEEVTMTMAQNLIKMKAKKARILDEQMAKRLEDDEIYLKRKPISIAQARKNMIVYLKNMSGYKIQYFKGMTYDHVRPIFKKEYNHIQTFLKFDRDKEPTKKRAAKEIRLQESLKKLEQKLKS
nr:uncharacterized mitochondrial protein AtMg00810-like [Tanacetum cinerariifolium]